MQRFVRPIVQLEPYCGTGVRVVKAATDLELSYKIIQMLVLVLFLVGRSEVIHQSVPSPQRIKPFDRRHRLIIVCHHVDDIP